MSSDPNKLYSRRNDPPPSMNQNPNFSQQNSSPWEKCISVLEEDKKELQVKNKELKYEKEKLKKRLYDLDTDCKEQEDKNKKLKEEVEKLKTYKQTLKTSLRTKQDRGGRGRNIFPYQ